MSSMRFMEILANEPERKKFARDVNKLIDGIGDVMSVILPVIRKDFSPQAN